MLSIFSWCFYRPSDDGYHRFAVVSEYFGRGLFNKLTVVTEPPESSAPVTAPTPVPAPAPTPAPMKQATYGPGAEAKLRLQEGQSKQVFVPNTAKQVAPKGTSVIPVPEGRMRLMEQQQYSSSLEANFTQLEPKIHARKSPFASPKVVRKKDETKISSAIANDSKNPFEDTYDDSKNPFASEETNNPTNPFGEDDDYDKNLNPFS